MDVVGWKGDLFPFKLNVRDIRPIMSDRIHLAPSSWVTFEGSGFVVLSFQPQIAVADLNAEELPSYHRNIDMDEGNADPCRRRSERPSARQLFLYAAGHPAWRKRGVSRRVSSTAQTGGSANPHRHRRRHLPAFASGAGVCPNDGVTLRRTRGGKKLVVPRPRQRGSPK